MKKIFLFRFHQDFEVCRERLRILRHFNPQTPIYGLFGGKDEDYGEALRILSPALDGLWKGPSESPLWKWLHPDLMIKAWYLEVGHLISFDHLYDHEWDLLLTDSISNIYPNFAGRFVALTALSELRKVVNKWDWFINEKYRNDTLKYVEYMDRTYGIGVQTYSSVGPGPVFCRAFLEEFSNCHHPASIFSPIISEITYPGFAEALGYKLLDTDLIKTLKAASPARVNKSLFHCDGSHPISVARTLSELRRPAGRRSFHPVKDPVRLEQIQFALELRSQGTKPSSYGRSSKKRAA